MSEINDKLKNKKSATVVPVHPPKFYSAINFLKSYDQFVKKPHDLFFIFSYQQEARIFYNLVNKIDKELINKFKSIILPEVLTHKKSIVNVKKIYSMRAIFNNYDFIAAYDSESCFVKQSDLDLIYQDICNTKYLKANKSIIGGKIVKRICENLNLINDTKVIDETENFSLYWWFNEIPVYEKELFLEFFDWYMKHPKTEILQNDYYCFDYLVYGLWLISNKNYKLKKYEVPVELQIGAVEDFRLSQEMKDFISENFDSYWSINSKNFKSFEKIKLIFHTDNC